MKDEKKVPNKGTTFSVNQQDLNAIDPNVERGLEAAKKVIEVLNMPERITSKTVFPPKLPAIQINGVTAANYCNIVGITGQMKSGKTAVNTGLCAAAITGKEVLGLSVPNLDGRNVVYFDTEQAGHDTQNNIYNRICKRAGAIDLPNLYVYNLRGLALGNMNHVANAIFKEVNPALIVVDGCADFVASVNDELKARELIAYFLGVAEQLNALVVLILHDNHNTEKSRGHLGSELDRKAEAVLITQKDVDDVFTLKGKFFRHSGNIDHVQYQFDVDTGGFEFLQYVSGNGTKVSRVKNEAEGVVNELFLDSGIFTHSEICSKVGRIESIGFDAAKKRVATYLKMGLIEKLPDGQYCKKSDEKTPF